MIRVEVNIGPAIALKDNLQTYPRTKNIVRSFKEGQAEGRNFNLPSVEVM